MKVAIIGSGIAGNTVAYHLHREHQITVFETNAHIGGHTHTHKIWHEDREFNVDTGFIVFNDRTYPEFIKLLDDLGVVSQPSFMSFSVRNEMTGLEYNGTSLNALFAQRRNLFKPSFYRMIQDILRFNRESLGLLTETHEIKLGDYLAKNQYSPQFIRDYLVPMGAAIWSTDANQMMQFPARFLVSFFSNHGMLSINDRPQWRTIQGGSAHYVEALTREFKQHIRTNTSVWSVKRLENGVLVDGEHFDWLFMACHSDQALSILGDASVTEREILGAIPYQENSVVLHTDQRLLPRRKLAWAGWNYHVTTQPISAQKVTVTYNMNILQGLQSREPLLVTLNRDDAIAKDKIIKRLTYHHPLFTGAGVAAQGRIGEISGKNRTCYCGAYWRNGFHEDGVVSALNALQHFANRQAHV
ncbi:MAG: NAD(P)/FAD-dependent oxidoreductase [Methylophilaceae bacterium]